LSSWGAPVLTWFPVPKTTAARKEADRSRNEVSLQLALLACPATAPWRTPPYLVKSSHHMAAGPHDAISNFPPHVRHRANRPTPSQKNRRTQAMHISVTTLKRLCRRHGVKRWPHRQISGINRELATLEARRHDAAARGGAAAASSVAAEVRQLHSRRQLIIEVCECHVCRLSLCVKVCGFVVAGTCVATISVCVEGLDCSILLQVGLHRFVPLSAIAGTNPP